MQKFVILVISTTVLILCFSRDFIWAEWLLSGLLILSIFYLATLIIPFTFLGKLMIEKADPGDKPILKMLVANVLQENTNYTKLLGLVQAIDPHIVFLLETDQKWMDHMQGLKERYPYFIEVPMDNTYGMLFYSRSEIIYYKVNYLIDPEIPSLEIDIEFDNTKIRIFGLHPTPPSPTENLYSTDRDAEILMVAKTVKDMEAPCIVMGDLNDVAWSYTTELFLKTSGLLDPRRGRGWFNTYNARYVVFRWPLDHYFVSGHFRIVDMNVEASIDSDHFPISISVCLTDNDDSRKLEADPADKELADKKIRSAKM